MKRTGNLYGSICEPKNLRLAFYKAAKGRQDRAEIIQYRSSLDLNLKLLHQQLVSENLEIGDYHFFRIRDPKPRHICAAAFPERVLHHAVMNVCEPVLDRYAIVDSYACQKGKGSIKALYRAQKAMQSTHWYLKLDIRRFFASIDQSVMLRLLKRRIKDKSVLRLFSQVLDSYQTEPGKGMPIGNLISQHLSNLYLGYFDHWVKETLRVRHYVRYMDDFVLFSESKNELEAWLVEIEEFLGNQLKLTLKQGTQLNRCRFGLPFLGYRVYPDVLRLGTRCKKRFGMKLRLYEHNYICGRWSEHDLVRHLEPMLGFTQIAASKGFRKNVITRFGVLS
jgi:RNA-directed DNA polymerase